MPSGAATTTPQPDFDELMAVIKGDGPCNRQRMAHRRRAHSDGAWVREAAMAYAAKQTASPALAEVAVSERARRQLT